MGYKKIALKSKVIIVTVIYNPPHLKEITNIKKAHTLTIITTINLYPH